MVRSVSWLFLALLIAVPAAAQDVCRQFTRVPPMGSWAEYRIQGQGQHGQFKLAVVGSESREGKGYTWYEMSMEMGATPILVKILADGGLYAAMSDQKVAEVVVKFPGQPAMLMPGSMMEQMQSQIQDPSSQFGAGCESAVRVGAESLTTPAGTFSTVHFRIAEGPNPGEAWVSEDLPFGMVKWTGNRGETMELIGSGDGAVSQLTETPVRMPGMSGNR